MSPVRVILSMGRAAGARMRPGELMPALDDAARITPLTPTWLLTPNWLVTGSDSTSVMRNLGLGRMVRVAELVAMPTVFEGRKTNSFGLYKGLVFLNACD